MKSIGLIGRTVCRLLTVGMLAIAATAASAPDAAPGTTTESAEVLAVRAAREAQNEAIVAGDVDRIASFWTDDVSIRRALGAMTSGSAAYRRLFVEDPGTVYLRHTTGVEISGAWPLAFESGDWEGRLNSATGPVLISGRYSAQWVKRGERWLIRGEVFVPLSCYGAGCQWKAAR